MTVAEQVREKASTKSPKVERHEQYHAWFCPWDDKPYLFTNFQPKLLLPNFLSFCEHFLPRGLLKKSCIRIIIIIIMSKYVY